MAIVGTFHISASFTITDGSDMLWGCYEIPAQLRRDLECYNHQLGRGDLSCQPSRCFAPTREYIFQPQKITVN